MSLRGSSFTGFEGGNLKLTHRHRVLELGTRFRLLELSNRVNAGRVRVGWAGGRVGWTALDPTMFWEINKKTHW